MSRVESGLGVRAFYLLFMEDKRSIANRCLGSGPGHLSQDSDFHPSILLRLEGHPHSRAHDRSISINQFSGLLKPSLELD